MWSISAHEGVHIRFNEEGDDDCDDTLIVNDDDHDQT